MIPRLPPWSASSAALVLLLILTVPATYLGFQIHARHGPPLWTPAAGVLLAVLVLYGVAWAPAVLALALATAYLFGHPHVGVADLIGATAAGTVAYVLVAAGLGRLRFDVRIGRLRDGLLLAGAALVAPLGSVALRGLVLVAEGASTWSSFGHTYTPLAIRETAGAECWAPLLILGVAAWARFGVSPAHATEGLRRLGRRSGIELALQLAALVVAAILAESSSLTSPRFYPLLIPLAWIALRWGVTGAAGGVVIGSAVAVSLAARTHFTTGEVEAIGAFLSVFAISGTSLGSLESQRQRDLSDRRAIERALRDSEERSRLLIEGSTDYAICMLDPDGIVVTWNVGAQRISGYRAEEIVGGHFSILYPPESLAANKPAEALRLAAKHRFADEGWRVRKDGSRYWAGVVITALWDQAGQLRGYGMVTHDQTERKEAEQQLTALATHDGLTGLPNRGLFMERLEQALAHADRRHGSVALLFADLDRFKNVNDTWGHDAGDQVLSLVASRIRSVLRPSDTAARLGGDEFVIVCEDLAGDDEVVKIARRVEEAVAKPCELAAATVTITASIGIAFASPSDSAEDLLRHADEAMYAAKQRGRAQHRIYRGSADAGLADRNRTREDLRGAMGRGELTLAYEPVIDLHTGQVIGVEALARWLHPTEGLLMPTSFIPLAETDGLIVTVGDWIVRTACAEVAEWQQRLHGWRGTLFINVSGRQLTDPQIADQMRRALSESGLPADRVCLETTETVLLRADRATRDVIDAIKQLGVRLAIDDFGTGYASLSNLREFPFDVVKIDRTFSAGLGVSADDEALVRTILELAESLGLDAITEGIETLSQLEHLLRLGGRLAQGHIFGRAISLDEAGDLVTDGMAGRGAIAS